MKYLEKLFDIPNKFYYLLFLFISIIIFFISEKIYSFDLDIINEQDARYYIQLAKNPLLFFDINPYYSSRILGPLLVYVLNQLTDINLFYSFKLVNLIVFTILNIQLFSFFKKKTNGLNSFILISLLNFSNWVLLYNFFNPYQLLDLLTFLIITNLTISLIERNSLNLFFWSLLGILNKHYIIIIIIACYFIRIFESKNKNKNKNIIYLIIILLFFYLFHKFSGINSSEILEQNNSIYNLLFTWLNNRLYNIPNYFISFILDNNIQILMPFIFCLFNKKVNIFLKKNYLLLLYPLIITSITVTMYDKFGGDNFSRIFYQSFYPIFILGFYKLFEINKTKYLISLVLIVSSLAYGIEYLLFFINLENNFVSYMVYERYTIWYSPVYISSLLFLYLINNVEKKI